jgi:hypothetical protein
MSIKCPICLDGLLELRETESKWYALFMSPNQDGQDFPAVGNGTTEDLTQTVECNSCKETSETNHTIRSILKAIL